MENLGTTQLPGAIAPAKPLAGSCVARRPRLLVVGPLPPPFIGPAVATDRLIHSPVLGEVFDIDCLDTSDYDGIDDMGVLSMRNIKVALRHGGRFWKLVAAHRPDLVYISIDRAFWGFLRDTQFLFTARLWRVPVVVHLRAGRFDLRHDFGLVGRLLARVGLAGVSRGLVLGESVRDIFGSLIDHSAIRVVPNGIDLMSWTFDEAVIERRRSTSVRVLYLANLYNAKGSHVMLNALPAILREVPELRVTFAGRWISREFEVRTRELVEQLGISGNVEFLGGVEGAAKRKLLSESHMLAFVPIEPEGLPWVVLEAMASALPVIGTPQGTMKEVIVDGETGWLVPPGDAPALAQRVIALARDRELAERAGRAGRHRVETVYSETAAHDALLRVALESIGRGAAQEGSTDAEGC